MDEDPGRQPVTDEHNIPSNHVEILPASASASASVDEVVQEIVLLCQTTLWKYCVFYKVKWSLEDSLIFQILPKQLKVKQIKYLLTDLIF